MYAREWKCRCPKRHKEDFIQYLYETGIKDTSCTHGFCGAQIFTRELADEVEITLITYWDTMESIRAFSGEDIEKAVLYPEDYKYELKPDAHATHYVVVEHQFIRDAKAVGVKNDRRRDG
jgi:heme-degrading monooxygenase HmoA